MIIHRVWLVQQNGRTAEVREAWLLFGYFTLYSRVKESYL